MTFSQFEPSWSVTAAVPQNLWSGNAPYIVLYTLPIAFKFGHSRASPLLQNISCLFVDRATQTSHVMSLSIAAYPFAGCWSQSQPCLRARAGYSLDKSPAHRRALTDEQCGVQYLAQGHFDMQLRPAQSRDLNQRPSNHWSTRSTR